MSSDHPTYSIEVGVGLKLPDRDDTWYQVDVAVAADPPPLDQYWIETPILLAEILSPGTQSTDRRKKLPDFLRFPTLREVLLITQDRPLVELHRRATPAPDARWECLPVEGLAQDLPLDGLSVRLPLAELYKGVPLAP